MKATKSLCTIAALSGVLFAASALAQSTAFTYQGQLTDGGAPATGSYDFEFSLFDISGGGTAVAGPLTNTAVAVSNGLFTTALDFGAGVFDGTQLWLGIGVQANSGSGFTSLAPRTELTATPYAMHCATAGTVLWTDISGVPSGFSGGVNNSVGAASSGATIGGGSSNAIGDSAPHATVAGGYDNDIGDDSGLATVAGGGSNAIGTNSWSSTVSGGFYNDIGADSSYATVAGGYNNDIGTNLSAATVSGGSGNAISAYADYATIAGGYNNTILVDSGYATVSGGSGNTIDDWARYATVAGGLDNYISGLSPCATISGGFSNDIGVFSSYATIAGGCDNSIGNSAPYAYAAGRRAKANHSGAFVWGDSQDEDVSSTTNNQMVVRAQNGLRLTEEAGSAATTIGDRYRDNAIVAWGKVAANGDLRAGFGLDSVTYIATGYYWIHLTDTAASIHSLIPVATAEVDLPPLSASMARIVSINQDPTTANRFEVYINNGNYNLVDNDFVFIVTGR